MKSDKFQRAQGAGFTTTKPEKMKHSRLRKSLKYFSKPPPVPEPVPQPKSSPPAATALCVRMAKSTNRSGSPSPRGSIFSNFETVQLSNEERLYLHSARLGDVLLIKELLLAKTSEDKVLNVNCADYMGRNALHLAVDSENIDTIEALLDVISWDCIEEALLHAISKGCLNLVRLIVEHPKYPPGERQVKRIGRKDAFFRTEEKYQYPPDITPLILAAHKNDHEMIQLFLSRGYTIDRPHAIHCQCEDCIVKQNCDSLKRSRSRLNAYKALSSPPYMALSSPDPITATFELRQEMMQVCEVEKEFTEEYLRMVEQCMEFACQMMDLCRGTQEVEAVLGEEGTGTRDPLARLTRAIRYGEKKFVAHPNCQQHLTSIWYGKEMGFLQSAAFWKKFALCLFVIPACPFLCIAYIIKPDCKMAAMLRCPVTKFATHTVSHFAFLFLLALATFGINDIVFKYGDSAVVGSEISQDQSLESVLRPAKKILSNVQMLIIFWVVGLTWVECKQIYHSGAREHFVQQYNIWDFSLLALYIASYSLRYVVWYRVEEADARFNATLRAKAALDEDGVEGLRRVLDEIVHSNKPGSYFLKPSRFDWRNEDPEIIAEILFAIANVLSFARTTYVMPAHELLGPLQASLGRMMGDIARFLVLFLMVLFAFMVGMTNLYLSYGSHINEEDRPVSETFKGLFETMHALFFSIFGLVALKQLSINHPEHGHDAALGRPTMLADQVGFVMFAVYQVAVTIMLVNMLIAMMSHSFEAIQGDADVEWKFARTKLWVNYIDEGVTLPVPFNMMPTPKSLKYTYRFFRNIFKDEDDEPVQYNFNKRRENILLPDLEAAGIVLSQKSTYADIIQRLVRRYLFKLDREKYDPEKNETISRIEDANAVEGLEESDEYGTPSPLQPVTEEHPLEAVPQSQGPKFVLDLADGGKEPTIPTIATPSPIASPEPMSPPSRLSAPEIRGIPRSSSASAMRDVTRRATAKRGSLKRSPQRLSGTAQLDAIQRGQKLLDARLQDLTSLNRNEEQAIQDNVMHVSHLTSMNQKALGDLVQAISAIREQIKNINVILKNKWGVHSKETAPALKSPGSEPADGDGGAGPGGQGKGGRIAQLRRSLKKKRPHDV